MDYLEPWFAVNDPGLADELRRELSPCHILTGLSFTARARRRDRDDVLFDIQDGSGRLAQVHLTYQKESDSRWPLTIVFSTEAEWASSAVADDDNFQG